MKVEDGEVEWGRAGKVLAEHDPESFARLLALASAAASLCEEELEDEAVFRARMAAINAQKPRTFQ